LPGDFHSSRPLIDREVQRSGAADWPLLRRFIAAEDRLAIRMAGHPATAGLYEFLRFGMKQAWACLFGGAMVLLLIATYLWYPPSAPLARYDFLLLASLAIQAALLALRLETVEEAKVIFAYHLVGTVMEIFKTSAGSWIYPEPSLFRIAGVPLFSGFMYSCIGSYLCRAWTLFHFEFEAHPPISWLAGLSVAAYANFFAHHYLPDARWVLFVAAGVVLAPTRVYFINWRSPRWMPLLLGLLLVTAFIWLAENVGTYTRTWLYPNQRGGWSMVGAAKFGSWFLLLIISYTLVALIKKPRFRERLGSTRRANADQGIDGPTSRRPQVIYVAAAIVIIAAGLLWRWPGLGLPPPVAKYGGSVLWGAMVFFVVAAVVPSMKLAIAACVAALVAAGVEASQLVHVGWLDDVRATVIGALLFGRTFTWWDIASYWVGIAGAYASTALARRSL
jgi:uncharacterized membrane protein YoaT (DUF817 family)